MKSVTFQTATALSIRSAALLLALWAMPATARGQIFVASAPANHGDGAHTIGEYNATTGATVNASLVSGLSYPVGHRGVWRESVCREQWQRHDWRIHDLGGDGERRAGLGVE